VKRIIACLAAQCFVTFSLYFVTRGSPVSDIAGLITFLLLWSHLDSKGWK
jgi:hypothetical protein